MVSSGVSLLSSFFFVAACARRAIPSAPSTNRIVDNLLPPLNDTEADADPRLCVVYPAKSYFVKENWIDIYGDVYYPTQEEAVWKGDPLELRILGGARETKDENDWTGRAIQMELCPWDRSKTDLYYYVAIAVKSYDCDVEAKFVQEYKTQQYWDCRPTDLHFFYSFFFFWLSRVTFENSGRIRFHSEYVVPHYYGLEWTFDVNGQPPTATPDPSCLEQS